MNNLWCTNYSSVRTNTRFTVNDISFDIFVFITIHVVDSASLYFKAL